MSSMNDTGSINGTSNINEEDVTSLMRFVINLIQDLPVSE